MMFGTEYTPWPYALTAAVAVAGFLSYLRTVAWPYLGVGVLGVTGVVPEAIIDWTGSTLGPPGGVLLAGMTLLGASPSGLRIRQETTGPDSTRRLERRRDDRSPVAH
jgi:hypothetical protein